MTWSSLARDALLYLMTVALAVSQNWDAGDLLWSFWTSSLVLGYAMIVIGCVLMPATLSLPGNPINNKDQMTPTIRVLLAIVMTPMAIFMLGFFTIHFGMFHFVHSIFLNEFFPLGDNQYPDMSGDDLFPFGVLSVIPVALTAYWPFVVITAIREFDSFRQIVVGRGLGFITPYIKVIKMHLTIFVVAFAAGAGMTDYGLYFLLVMYFIPLMQLFRELWTRIRQT